MFVCKMSNGSNAPLVPARTTVSEQTLTFCFLTVAPEQQAVVPSWEAEGGGGLGKAPASAKYESALGDSKEGQ